MLQTSQRPAEVGQSRPTRINPRIFLLTLGMFALGTDAFVVAGVLPGIAREMRVTEGLAGQLVTAFSLTYGLGAPLLAAFTGRWSRNRVLIGALALFSLANVATALAPTFLLLVLARILTGCFAATFAPLAYTTGVSLAPPEKRGRALSLVVFGLTVATAIGSPVGTWVGEHAGWRMSFVLVAILAGLAVLALLLAGLPKADAQPVLSLRARLAPLKEPRLLLALLPAFVWNVGIYTLYTYIAPFLRQNMRIEDISGQLIAFGVGVASASLVAGMVSDRFGAKRPLIATLVLLIVMQSILGLLTTTLFGGLAALFVWGLLASLLFVPQQHRLLSLAPEHANVILAFNNSTFYLGVAGGSTVGGLALHFVPVTLLAQVGAGAMLLALALFALSLRLSERRAPAPVCREAQKVLLSPE